MEKTVWDGRERIEGENCKEIYWSKMEFESRIVRRMKKDTGGEGKGDYNQSELFGVLIEWGERYLRKNSVKELLEVRG